MLFDQRLLVPTVLHYSGGVPLPLPPRSTPLTRGAAAEFRCAILALIAADRPSQIRTNLGHFAAAQICARFSSSFISGNDQAPS